MPAAVGRRDSVAPWFQQQQQPEDANDTSSAPRGDLQEARIRNDPGMPWAWTLHPLPRITKTSRLVETDLGQRGGQGWPGLGLSHLVPYGIPFSSLFSSPYLK